MKKFFITLGLILILTGSSLAFDMPWDLGTKYCKLIQKTTAPTSSDVSYQIGTVWLDTTNDVLYQLTDITSGVATWSYKVSNFSTKATPGTELITWTDAGWNEDGATWTFAASTLTHVTGNVTAVTGTVTGALAIGTTYRVIITGTGGTATATYTLGGCTGTTIAASGAIAIEDYITATADSELVITPSNTCTVALTLVSVKALTDATGDLTVDGNGTFRSPSTFWGLMTFKNGISQQIITHSASETVTDEGMYGGIHKITDAYTVTLPAAVIGMSGTFRSSTAAAFSVDTNAADHFEMFAGTVLDAGDKLTSGGTKNEFVTIYCESANTWIVIGQNGAFTDGGA